MELKLSIHDKDVDFVIGDQHGQGLEDLIKTSDQLISEISIEGETKSYSFLRQICLFVNLLKRSKDISLDLRSDSFKLIDGTLVPVYE